MSRPVSNPLGRFRSTEIDWDEAPPPARLEIHPDHSRSILARNDSPDIPFTWSVNPYRGCTHACAYCYARAFHEYLDMGAGTDFERRLRVKLDAPTLLQAAFDKASWTGEGVVLSGVTDPYQPIERRYALTRGLLEVCARYRNPVGIITRSPLITRDIDLLQALAAHDAVRVNLSIPIADDELCRLIEPGAPAPSRRFAAIAALAKAGIPVGVSISPVIPGLNDAGIPAALQAARDAGAAWAWMIPVRLSPSVEQVFTERLREALPLRADSILARIRRMRGEGPLSGGPPGQRMKGQGEAWAATRRLFDSFVRRLGFQDPPPRPDPGPFRRPGQGVQVGLFPSGPAR